MSVERTGLALEVELTVTDDDYVDYLLRKIRAWGGVINSEDIRYNIGQWQEPDRQMLARFAELVDRAFDYAAKNFVTSVDICSVQHGEHLLELGRAFGQGTYYHARMVSEVPSGEPVFLLSDIRDDAELPGTAEVRERLASLGAQAVALKNSGIDPGYILDSINQSLTEHE